MLSIFKRDIGRLLTFYYFSTLTLLSILEIQNARHAEVIFDHIIKRGGGKSKRLKCGRRQAVLKPVASKQDLWVRKTFKPMMKHLSPLKCNILSV